MILVPGAGPANVVTLAQSREVFVQWDPIPREQVHGILLGYTVTYFGYHGYSQTITTNHTQVVIKNLIPAMRYVVIVSGFTARGYGLLTYHYPVTSE